MNSMTTTISIALLLILLPHLLYVALCELLKLWL